MQFADGVYLVLLMGLLEDYFVPLYNFFLTPESFEQKVITPLKSETEDFLATSVSKLTFHFYVPSGSQCGVCL